MSDSAVILDTTTIFGYEVNTEDITQLIMYVCMVSVGVMLCISILRWLFGIHAVMKQLKRVEAKLNVLLVAKAVGDKATSIK